MFDDISMITFEYCSSNCSSLFDVSKIFNEVGVDVREYNEFDNVDVGD